MFRCQKTARKAHVTIKLQEDRAVVTYTIDPRHGQKAEMHFKLNDDVIQDITKRLKQEVIPQETYNLTIEISSLTGKDSTERKNINARRASATLDTYITAQLTEHLSQHVVPEERGCCAVS